MSIGQDLAAGRRRAGFTVGQVSQRTRIRETIITGIEGDDYSVCGGDFYARGHIRSIARAVGSDPEPLIREYDTVHRAPGALSAVSLAELAELATPPPPPGQRRPGWAAVLGLVVVVVALGLVVYHVLSGPRQAGSAAPAAGRQVVTHHRAGPGAANPATKSKHAAAAPRGAVPVQALTPVSAAAFGPYGAGQGDNPQVASLAIDRDPATAWRTDWYTTARFGNLYPGTGLLLDMGRAVTITGVRISLGSGPGAAFQLRVGNAPVLAGLPPVAGRAGRHGHGAPAARQPGARPLCAGLVHQPAGGSGRHLPGERV